MVAVRHPRCLLAAVWLAAAAGIAWAQPDVPRVIYDNPVAGLSIEIPEDWEMGTSDYGMLNIGMEAGLGASTCRGMPMLWFFFTKTPPEQMARELAQGFQALDGCAPQVLPFGQGDWEVRFTSNATRGPLSERWVCKRQGRISYVIAAMVRPEFAAHFQADLDTALNTAHLIPGPPLQLFTEPTERAYRMVFPQGWQWSGRIIRTATAPGVFEWKVQTPDGLVGAFNAPPASLNIMVPYAPAAECAGTFVLQGLQQEVPDARLESVHELPRAGAYFMAAIKALGLGENPRVDKARAEYLGTRNGTPVRIHVDIGTFMLDASPLLGGRGNWILMCSGGWAPVDRFAQLYPICRGIVASIATDPVWKERQSEWVWLDRYWKAWHRRFSDFKFIEGYLGRSYNDMPQLHDSDLHPPGE